MQDIASTAIMIKRRVMCLEQVTLIRRSRNNVQGGRKTRPRARRDRMGRGVTGTDSAANAVDQVREGFARPVGCGERVCGTVAIG